MKKYLVFIIACLGVCLLPFAGMAVRPTTVSTENRAMPEFPSLKGEDGGLNLDFFQEFETYFNKRFAFRNELVYADAKIQGGVFQTSNVDSVIYGRDGWLYYASTLEDYLGYSRMSERQIYNLAHNLSLAQQYVEQKGADFVLAIPPNKNTLYGGYMPYYNSCMVDQTHNLELLGPKLEKLGVPYADLLEMFRGENEVLYLKRDSHWNGKGAVMAYNRIMDTLGYVHRDYGDSPVTRAKDEDGDLNRMLYTLYGEKELNYKYQTGQGYAYANEVESVEDVWIETEGGEGNGTLLMFRDSFGNTLIPLIADQFTQAWFTKESPYGLETLMERHRPDTVVLEKVERNLWEYLDMPPVISAWKADIPQEIERMEPLETDIAIGVESLEYDSNYYKIRGSVKKICLEEETDILVRVNDTCYQTYHTNDTDFEFYIKKEDMPSFPLKLQVIVEDQGRYRVVQEKIIEEERKLP